MKRLIFIPVFLLACTFMYAQQPENNSILKISDLVIEQQNDLVKLRFTAEVSPEGVGDKQMITVFPQLRSDERADILAEFPEIIIRGKRAQKKFERKGDDVAMGYAVKRPYAVNAVNGSVVEYEAFAPYGAWMDGCTFLLEGILRSKAYAAETEIGIVVPGMKIAEEVRLVYPQ